MFLIKYLKSYMYIFISIIILSLIVGTLSYFNVISISTSNILEIVSIIIAMFVGGFYIGRKSNKKGYIEGLKIGSLMIFLVFILSSFFFDKSINLSSLVFYVIILISSVLGSIISKLKS